MLMRDNRCLIKILKFEKMLHEVAAVCPPGKGCIGEGALEKNPTILHEARHRLS